MKLIIVALCTLYIFYSAQSALVPTYEWDMRNQYTINGLRYIVESQTGDLIYALGYHNNDNATRWN